MFPRVFAFLMAMVMLWSSLAVAEQRFAEALETPASTAVVSCDAKRSDVQGSMDDHWVDDQPSQAFAEPALDLALWVDMHCAVPRCAIMALRPARVDEALHAPPFLEGLRRPPRSV